jgi:hypothetical protein
MAAKKQAKPSKAIPSKAVSQVRTGKPGVKQSKAPKSAVRKPGARRGG